MMKAFPCLIAPVMGLVIGLITGLFYFGGLLFTVKRIGYSRNPKRMLTLSAALRLLPTLTIMLILINKDPGMFAAMTAAFFLVRFIMIKRNF